MIAREAFRKSHELIRRLFRSPSETRWRARVARYGRRAVLNVGHSDDDFEAVTEAQKREILPHLRRHLIPSDRIVLDFGCGPGRFTHDLAQSASGRAIGLDVVKELIDLAPAAPNVAYGLMKEGIIPLADESVDVAWVCLVLGGLDGRELQRSARELGRVLRPGGLLFLVENTSEKPDTETWKFRSVDAYRALFPSAALERLHHYEDLGERITLLAGRKTATPRWDLVLRSKTRWLDLNLSALWRYRDLTALFVWRDFVAQYKQTILGPLWHLIQPLFTTIIFTVIFGKMAGLPTDGMPPLLFYLAGITAWSYFADCLNRTSGTFIQNAGLFGKVYFPRLTVPVSIVISGLIKFAIQFSLLVAFIVFYWLSGRRLGSSLYVLLVPVLLVLMAGLSLGCGIIVAALTTKYRDLQHLVTFGVQLLMYATPVVYPLSMVGGGRFRWLILINPMTPIIEAFRYALLGAGALDVWHLLYSGAATLLLLTTGIILFNHVERVFMDTV